MLNKDQYNQDEYNNYYKQETEGAEIKGYNENEGGFLKKAILFLGIIILAIAGYFGFKIFNNNVITKEKPVIEKETVKNTINKENTSITENSKTQAIEDKVIKTIENNKAKINEVVINTEKTAKELEKRAKAVEDKLEETIQKEVATQVQEKLNNNKNMSTDDISKIVDLVMNKMEKEKVETTKENKDNDLLNALKDTEKDTPLVKPKKATIKTNSESIVKKELNHVTTHNKVTVDKSLSNGNDDLTALSEQIKKLLNMAGASDNSHKSITTKINTSIKNNHTTNYENSISKEIKVRTNEMRIIVVKPGDTLNKIAKRAYGDVNSYQKIFDANPDINRADKIYVGQKLRIPE